MTAQNKSGLVISDAAFRQNHCCAQTRIYIRNAALSQILISLKLASFVSNKGSRGCYLVQQDMDVSGVDTLMLDISEIEVITEARPHL